MKSKLLAVIGCARSGKSTFCNKWVKEPDNEGYTRIVISGDKVRLGLHGMRYIHQAEPIVHGIYSVMTKSLLLHDDYKIMLDDTHTTVSSIRNILNMNIDAEFIYIPCDLEVAKQRAIDTNQSDLIPVIDRMHQNLRKLYDYDKSEDDYPKNGSWFEIGIYRSVEKIRDEVRKVKEYSNRSV